MFLCSSYLFFYLHFCIISFTKKCNKKHLRQRQAINEISLITYISLVTYLRYAINEILLIAYLRRMGINEQVGY